MISLVVAASINNAIGKNNQLLWHLPNDLRFFKNLTWGGVVVMGRKTFESVNKPLPGRLNIVITGQRDWHAAGVVVVPGLQEAIKYANEANYKEIFIIGGGEIYKQSLSIADRVYLTRVDVELDGDTFFPDLSSDEWSLEDVTECPADEKNKYAHRFEVWKRS